MSTRKPKNILIAPLDWGAGHTTRCIPIINTLLQSGNNPIVAGNPAQLKIFSETFPDISTVLLDGYNIRYSEANRLLQLGILSQLPRLVHTIKKENEWLAQRIDELQLDGVISDNRYGLYSANIPSVIITHQLLVQSGAGFAVDRMLQKLHYRYLNRFQSVWVPDVEDERESLAGTLSHAAVLPDNCDYIGLLSRFAGTPNPETNIGDKTLLVLLSGPEPQRTILSGLLWKQVSRYKGQVVFAEGSDTAQRPNHIPEHITYHARLSKQDLLPELLRADMVICRSGYSTLMDLIAVGKRAIVIPTPGQTEQEYLGKQLHSKGMFYSAAQSGFDLEQALQATASFPFKEIPNIGVFGQHEKVINKWVQAL